MANSNEMQAAITKVAIQEDTVAVRAMREAYMPSKPPAGRNNPEEHHRPRQAGPMLRHLTDRCQRGM